MFKSMILLLLLLSPSLVFSASSHHEHTFDGQISTNIRTFQILRNNLQKTIAFAKARPDLFKPDKNSKKQLIKRDDKMAVWNNWSSILDSVAALDALRHSQKRMTKGADKRQREAANALANATFLCAYRNALEFIALADKNSAMNTILNEPVPEIGLPAGTYDRFKFRFLNVAIATEFAARQVIDSAAPSGPDGIRRAIEEDRKVIWGMGKGKGHELTLKNAAAIVHKSGFTAWFPLQKGVSEWMGDTKVLRNGNHLITTKQAAALRSRLQPGDIIFERHEWYLSNLGLPGFWTHVALYIGTPEERRQLFNDPEVKRWVQKLGASSGDLEELLRQRYAAAYMKSIAPLEQKHQPRILEAISEGVSFTSLEHSAASDSIAVIRPRLSHRDKAQAILRAFHYSGRPYDFNFDFETDSALVCSELVFKVYEPGNGQKGLRFPLTDMMGRKLSTPNGMVRQFDEQYNRQEMQSDFVLFLDGFEKQRRALEGDLSQFRASWRRPNWHILIQKQPE